jgi:hypothetical protein
MADYSDADMDDKINFSVAAEDKKKKNMMNVFYDLV